MRLLVLLLLVAVVVVVWVMWRRWAASAALRHARRYELVETTSGGEAFVHISDGRSTALIGSVPLSDDDFDARYAELVLRAEDRASTLNASRELRPSA